MLIILNYQKSQSTSACLICAHCISFAQSPYQGRFRYNLVGNAVLAMVNLKTSFDSADYQQMNYDHELYRLKTATTMKTTSATTQSIPRFIPYRQNDIVEMCLVNTSSDMINHEDFRKLTDLLSSIFHFQFHKTIESLKTAYAPIDPDTDTRHYAPVNQSRNNTDQDNFIDLMRVLLEQANYNRISQDELNQAMNKSSLFKIRLQVDFDDFSEALLFYRGETLKSETVKRFFGLSSRTIEFINFERVVIYIRFREDYEDEKDDMPGTKPGATLLKLFQNVPRADLEMLFPNTCIRMRTIDKLIIGVPAVISGAVVLTTKLGASLVLLGSLFGFWFGLHSQPVELNKTALMALLAGMVALGGYLWKQFNNFKNRKLRFMQSLTQNLYFKNLDNNSGVFHRLVNDAEEEECKEATLAYYFLLTNPQGLTKPQLDKMIESWLETEWQCTINFEIQDALEKLKVLGLIESNGGVLHAISIDECIQKLIHRWDMFHS